MKTSSPQWGKLDNTAHLFPVIASKKTSNVFRESVTLTEKVWGDILQEALEDTLKIFPGFSVHLQKGLFWYYLEENIKTLPPILEEDDYPCRQIDYNENRGYLFKVSYYKNRINLETFHALADGLGAKMFLKGLVYHYLKLSHTEIVESPFDADISLEREDSFQHFWNKNNPNKSNYSKLRALSIKGRKLHNNGLSIIEGTMRVDEVKLLAKENSVTINEYLVAIYLYSLYLNNFSDRNPIIVLVPVNLRAFFNSSTTKNFFTMANAIFVPTKNDHPFEEVLFATKESLRSQITKENFQKTISYNVANEQNQTLRWVPLLLKNIGIKLTYLNIAKASTTTMTNLGKLSFKSPFDKYIEKFSGILPMSAGQNIKATVGSFENKLCITFSSTFRNSKIQKIYFRELASRGVKISVTTNGENNVSL